MNTKNSMPSTFAVCVLVVSIGIPLLIVSCGAAYLVAVICARTIGCSTAIQMIPSLLTFGATVLLVMVTVRYAYDTHRMAQTMGQQTESDLLMRLGELYARPDTRKAVRTFHDAKRKDEMVFRENRYRFAEKFLSDPENRRGSANDDLRWHLVNFWYTLAVLVERKIITHESVFQRFGPPDVLDILEPVEAVLAYQLRYEGDPATFPDSFRVDWPPLKLFVSWTKQSVEDRVLSLEQLPAFPEEFNRWVSDYTQRRHSGIQA